MNSLIDVPQGPCLADYAASVHLAPAVEALRQTAARMASRLRGRTVWVLNSTAQGGGVAEMLPRLNSLLRQLGTQVEWYVLEADDPKFFLLTKRLHNMIHGVPGAAPSTDESQAYRAVSVMNADRLMHRVQPDDIVVIHDPQPAGVGAELKRRLGVRTVWRCHIGLDQQDAAADRAWEFLRPELETYDRSVFSTEWYPPSFLRQNSVIIPPAIDPLSHKNRELPIHKLTGILSNASLAFSLHPLLTEPFEEPVRRLQPNGSWAAATHPEELGLLFRPIVTQVSRWDNLKGFEPLLEGFVRLKTALHPRRYALSRRQQARLDIVRLVLAGPDPQFVQDDPEAQEMLHRLGARWQELAPSLQRDIAILLLPMSSRKANALMVNALQRCSTIVVQNSLREGFGLTVAEAMWKGCPVLGSRAAGVRSQVRSEVDGLLVADPSDAEELASALERMLSDPKARDTWGQNAQRRVADEFLVLLQAQRWLELLGTL